MLFSSAKWRTWASWNQRSLPNSSPINVFYFQIPPIIDRYIEIDWCVSGATSKDLVPLITLYVRMVLAADPFSHLKMQEPNCGFCIVSSIKCRGGVVADLVFPVGLAAQIHCAGLCIRYKSYCKVLDRWNNITLAYPNGHSPLSPSVDTRHSEYPPGQGRSMLTNAFPLAGRCRLFPRKH